MTKYLIIAFLALTIAFVAGSYVAAELSQFMAEFDAATAGQSIR